MIAVLRPRRGKVETDIKQPRESEIRSHQEKTERYLKAIEIKMTGTA